MKITLEITFFPQPQPLLKCNKDVFICCVFYFVALLIDEQEWRFVRNSNDGFGHDFAELCVVMAVRTGVSDGKQALQYK